MSAVSHNEETLLEQALRLESSQAREAFLAEACGSDQGLRRRIESLLQAHEAAGCFLEPKVAPSQAGELTASKIGRYELIRKIGEGGCGVVYEAEQLAPVRRRVALKVVKAGMDTKAVIARFEAERQALALMDHPNIAKILDAGTTEPTLSTQHSPLATNVGRPYFVMELVNGVKITDYCRDHNLPIHERLNLFLQICDAVQHAHQKGIIHRDLKPSNILVSNLNPSASAYSAYSAVNPSSSFLSGKNSALPKVIDFGIAKAIEGKLTDATIHTGLHQFLGTPAYMSPEQADLSPDIDTRTDIYSLGVLLYELFTGKPPFDNHELLTAGLDEMRRILREKEPPRPSQILVAASRESAADSKSVFPNPHSEIVGDLDCIVLKCLEKDRSRRYESVAALAADLQHYINNEPVLARPPSTTYRLEKFVRRNKIQFAAGAVAIIALLTAVVVSSRQAVKAKRAEQNALKQAKIAAEQTDIARQESDKAKAVRDYLIENLLGVDCCGESPDGDALTFEATQALVKKVARNLDGKFTNQPLTEAEIRMAVIKSLNSSRDYSEIIAQATKALNIWQNKLGLADTNTLDTIKVLAHAKHTVGQRDEAFALLTNALSLARASATNGILSQAASALVGTYGIMLTQENRAAEAIPHLHEAVAYAKRYNSATSIVVKAWKAKLAGAFDADKNFREAEKLWREVHTEYLRDQSAEHPLSADAEFGLARALLQQKEEQKAKEALEILERVLPFNERKLGKTNFSTLVTSYFLGKAYYQTGNINAATKLYSDLHPKLAKYLHYPIAVDFCDGIADYFIRQGLFSNAIPVYADLRRVREKHRTDDAGQFENYFILLARAEGWPAVAKFLNDHFDAFPDSIWLWLNKAWIFRYVGDDEQYHRVVRQILTFPTAQLSTNDLHIPLEIASLGQIDFTPEQLSHIDARIRHLESIQPNRGTNEQVWGYRAIAQMQLRLHRPEEALAALEQASKQNPPDAYTLYLKAACLHHLGRHSDARSALSDAQARSKEQLTESVPPESFMKPWDLYQHLVMRRETELLIAGKDESPR